MGIPILVRQHLYTESPPDLSVSPLHITGPANLHVQTVGRGQVMESVRRMAWQHFWHLLVEFHHLYHSGITWGSWCIKSATTWLFVQWLVHRLPTKKTPKLHNIRPLREKSNSDHKPWRMQNISACLTCKIFHFSNMIYKMTLQKSTCPSGQAMGFVETWTDGFPVMQTFSMPSHHYVSPFFPQQANNTNHRWLFCYLNAKPLMIILLQTWKFRRTNNKFIGEIW